MRKSYPTAACVDFGGALLVPLLVNAHTHLELSNFPQWLRQSQDDPQEPAGFVDWILQLIRVKRDVTQQQYRSALTHGIEQSLAAGTGAVGDILAHHGARDLYRHSPLGGRLFLETLGQDPAIIQRLRKSLYQLLEEDACGKLQLGVSPHSPYTLRESYLRTLYRDCRKWGLHCSTHLAESAEEVAFVRDARGEIASRLYPFIGWESFLPRAKGLRPVAYLDRQGGLFPQNLLVHGVQLADSEIALLAERGMHLVLCPRSNARLKVGRAAAGKLHRAGVKLALGTDSLASCDSLSIWDEMAFAQQWFAGELDPPTLFQLATRGGAAALGLATEMTLTVGQPADFQVLQPPTEVEPHEIFDYLVATGRQRDIVDVVRQGNSVRSWRLQPGAVDD
jgi:cytosine/adenosine deaminase-related metal-dependent hydrolase